MAFFIKLTYSQRKGGAKMGVKSGFQKITLKCPLESQNAEKEKHFLLHS